MARVRNTILTVSYLLLIFTLLSLVVNGRPETLDHAVFYISVLLVAGGLSAIGTLLEGFVHEQHKEEIKKSLVASDARRRPQLHEGEQDIYQYTAPSPFHHPPTQVGRQEESGYEC